MKIALVHDYIKEYGGAERVLETLHELYPNAPVYTTVYLPEYLGPHKDRFKDWEIHTSFLQKIPFAAKLISPFRLLSPFAFRSFNFSQYDVVIVSATGAYFPNTIKTKQKNAKTTHICYCHTPPRYLYGYATAREWKKNILFRILGETANHFLRMVDASASPNVDYFLANSKEVAGRIKKFYRRDAKVIYPPVEIVHMSSSRKRGSRVDSRIHGNDKDSYFLAGGRLAKPKHIDIIVQACLELNVPLIIFGKGFAGYGEELERLAKKVEQRAEGKKNTIEFVGEVSDEEKLKLMAGAKAYLFAAEDEDLGITPIEAMGQGTPVIAYRSGGVQETVIEGKTGMFFDELSAESLQKKIQEFEKQKFDPKVCRDRAKVFAKERFKTEIQLFVAAISR